MLEFISLFIIFMATFLGFAWLACEVLDCNK